MKKMIYGGLLVFAVLLITACSSYQYYSVGSSSKVGRYSTFAWLPPVNNTKNPYFNNDLADEKIKDQATADLESKGLHLKAKRPDLLVKTFNEPQYTYVGGGYYPRVAYYRGHRFFYYSYSSPYPVYVGDDIYHVPYKEGTLILDIIDRSTHKVIWRGYGVGEVDNPEKALNDLPEVVNGILNKLEVSRNR